MVHSRARRAGRWQSRICRRQQPRRRAASSQRFHRAPQSGCVSRAGLAGRPGGRRGGSPRGRVVCLAPDAGRQTRQLDGVGDVCHVSGLVWRHAHGRPEREVPEAGRSGPVFAACAAAALYRRYDWVRMGGLDERFFCYVEDVDLGFRLQLAAGRAATSPMPWRITWDWPAPASAATSPCITATATWSGCS